MGPPPEKQTFLYVSCLLTRKSYRGYECLFYPQKCRGHGEKGRKQHPAALHVFCHAKQSNKCIGAGARGNQTAGTEKTGLSQPPKPR